MIIYSKKFWEICTLGKLYGNSFPRALPFSLVSALLAALCQLLAPYLPMPLQADGQPGSDLCEEGNRLRCFLGLEHPYPFQAFAFVVGFMLVFRTQLSYGRYWEGCNQLHTFASKLTDVVVMALTFDRYGRENANKKKPPAAAPGHDSNVLGVALAVALRSQNSSQSDIAQRTADLLAEVEEAIGQRNRGQTEGHASHQPQSGVRDVRAEPAAAGGAEANPRLFQDTLLHLVSLLHAVALMTLREDLKYGNLKLHNSLAAVPPTHYRMGEHQGFDKNPGKGGADPALGDDLTTIHENGDGLPAELHVHRPDPHAKRWRQCFPKWARDICSHVAKLKDVHFAFFLRADNKRAKIVHGKLPIHVIGKISKDEYWKLGFPLTSRGFRKLVKRAEAGHKPGLDGQQHREQLMNEAYANEDNSPGHEFDDETDSESENSMDPQSDPHILYKGFFWGEWLYWELHQRRYGRKQKAPFPWPQQDRAKHLARELQAQSVAGDSAQGDSPRSTVGPPVARGLSFNQTVDSWYSAASPTASNRGATGTSEDRAPNRKLYEDSFYIPAVTERVYTVQAWLQELLVSRIANGGIDVSSSIQSRIFNSLSQAMLGYEQCKKLTYFRFPLPWAQAGTYMLLMFLLSLPVVVACFVENTMFSVLITFLAAQTYTMLNEVARDIEDPFHYDPNELPLSQIQYRLNERLLAIAMTSRPATEAENHPDDDLFLVKGPANMPANTLNDWDNQASPAFQPAGRDYVLEDPTGRSRTRRMLAYQDAQRYRRARRGTATGRSISKIVQSPRASSVSDCSSPAFFGAAPRLTLASNPPSQPGQAARNSGDGTWAAAAPSATPTLRDARSTNQSPFWAPGPGSPAVAHPQPNAELPANAAQASHIGSGRGGMGSSRFGRLYSGTNATSSSDWRSSNSLASRSGRETPSRPDSRGHGQHMGRAKAEQAAPADAPQSPPLQSLETVQSGDGPQSGFQVYHALNAQRQAQAPKVDRARHDEQAVRVNAGRQYAGAASGVADGPHDKQRQLGHTKLGHQPGADSSRTPSTRQRGDTQAQSTASASSATDGIKRDPHRGRRRSPIPSTGPSRQQGRDPSSDERGPDAEVPARPESMPLHKLHVPGALQEAADDENVHVRNDNDDLDARHWGGDGHGAGPSAADLNRAANADQRPPGQGMSAYFRCRTTSPGSDPSATCTQGTLLEATDTQPLLRRSPGVQRDSVAATAPLGQRQIGRPVEPQSSEANMGGDRLNQWRGARLGLQGAPADASAAATAPLAGGHGRVERLSRGRRSPGFDPGGPSSESSGDLGDAERGVANGHVGGRRMEKGPSFSPWARRGMDG